MKIFKNYFKRYSVTVVTVKFKTPLIPKNSLIYILYIYNIYIRIKFEKIMA